MTPRIRPLLIALTTSAALASAALVGGGSAQAEPSADPPSKVLIVLFDQMRPEYATRFNMPNFRALQGEGTSFSKAYLNYMGSETVIAHNVLMSGQTPRNMGWVDEAYRDRKGLLSSDKNQMWITGELSYSQYGTLIKDKGYPKLADYLQEAQPGKKFIVVGQKGYAVESAAAESAWDTFTGDGTDIAVRFGSRSGNNPSDPCQIALGGRYRSPSGVNVPSYLKEP
jgi:predicted AlkP superfamily pyrophosphatase or phosphodiesterase